MRDHEAPSRQAIYYGWWIVVTLAITETFSWGIIYYAFQVFIQPMQADLGWSLSQLTGAYSAALLISGFVTLPVGIWLDKHGGRWMMTIASILATFLLLAWSVVDTLWGFYVIWVLLGALMAMLFYDPAFVIVTNWFVRRRGLALAIVTFAAGLASTIFLPLADFLLNQVGWRSAVMILAIVYGCVTIPLHALVLRRRPQDMGLLPDGDDTRHQQKHTPIVDKAVTVSDAIRSRTFILLCLGFGLSLLAANSIRVHFIPYAITIGITATTAAWLAGFIGITQVVGRLIFAPLEARFDARTVAIITFLVLGISFVMISLSQQLAMINGFVLVFGASYGALTLLRPVILADLYGSAHYGRINSIMSFMMILVMTASPIGTSLFVEAFGSYQPVIYGLTVIAFLAMIPIMMLPKRKQKFA